MAFALDSSLDTLVKIASSVFYSCDEEEAKEQKQKAREKATAFASVLRETDPKSDSQVSKKSSTMTFTCHHCHKPGDLKRDCTQKPPGPCPDCKGDHWMSDCPLSPRPHQGSDSSYLYLLSK